MVAEMALVVVDSFVVFVDRQLDILVVMVARRVAYFVDMELVVVVLALSCQKSLMMWL